MSFYRKKKILVTGGAGFIGSHLVEALVKLKARVTVPIRANRASFLTEVQDKIKLVNADLADASAATKVAQGQDLIFHLAAHLGGIAYNISHPATLLYQNLQLTINIIEAAKQVDVDRLLIVSSACVYPRFCTIPTPETEGFKDDPEPTNFGYGWSKRIAEILAKTYHQEFGLKVGIVRPYNAYGPRDNFDPKQSHVIPALVKRICDGENPLIVWGDGSATRSFIYVSDIVKGMLSALEVYPQPNPINLGTNEEISIKQLVNLIIQYSGKNPQVIFDASKPEGQPRRACDNRKAKTLLGFTAQVRLKQGLPKVIEYYRQYVQKKA